MSKSFDWIGTHVDPYDAYLNLCRKSGRESIVPDNCTDTFNVSVIAAGGFVMVYSGNIGDDGKGGGWYGTDIERPSRVPWVDEQSVVQGYIKPESYDDDGNVIGWGAYLIHTDPVPVPNEWGEWMDFATFTESEDEQWNVHEDEDEYGNLRFTISMRRRNEENNV